MSITSQFQQLDSLLASTAQYWQQKAFAEDVIPWPELNDVLLALSDDELAALDKEPERLQAFFEPYIPALNALPELIALTRRKEPALSFPFWLTNGVKGRKIQQLESFVSCIDESKLPILEWCAGKGHLGRMAHFAFGVAVHSVELQAPLVKSGQALAHKLAMPIRFSEQDVLAEDAHRHVECEQHAVALHACGQLHTQLMSHAAKAKTQKLTISPCCYHLISTPIYEPLSQLAAHSQITLSQDDLKLALQETVTAPARVTRLRQLEVTWRLGFDALQRDITGNDAYLPVPSVAKAIFSQTFADFCQWAAEKKGISLPQGMDYPAYLAKGQRRKTITDRIELVRHVFRRAIEIWLILDRVAYLEEQGYQVDVAEFCDKQVTPRNIIIKAARHRA